ncbi:hypothetical protein SCARD494_04767 [Seiridium cardinale]
MLFFKHFLTLGLGALAIWGSPIAPVAEKSSRSIEGQSIGTLHGRAVPNVVPVLRWDNLGPGTQTNPTFTAKMSTGIVGAPTHGDVAQYAQKAYSSMMSQNPRQKNTHLIAALYIPTTRSIYISSVPDGPGIGKIKGDGATAAPAWWSQVNNRPTLALHAEDAAAFLYEQSLTNKLAAGATYPAGSFIAVYGIVNGQNAQPVPPCSGGGNQPLDPPCRTVLTNLGVGF